MNIERYSRQLVLKEWSLRLQQKLALTSIALPASDLAARLYASALGIGTIYLHGEEIAGYQASPDKLNPEIKVRRLEPSSQVDFLFLPSGSPMPACIAAWVFAIDENTPDGIASLVASESASSSRPIQWPNIQFRHLREGFATGTQAVLLALSIVRHNVESHSKLLA